MAPAVVLDRAGHEYAPGRGVRGVSLAVGPGECCAVLGPNGSGKTTLTRLVLGLLRPAAGRVVVLGADVGAGSRAHLGRTAASLDSAAHWDTLSGWDNAWFAARARGLDPARSRAALGALFERAGLADQAGDPVRHYSFGMRRKLDLVGALCADPELLVLDEPTAGVDAEFQLELAEIVAERGRAGRATWVSGNDPEWVAGVAGRVVFLDRGEKVAEGSVSELLAALSPLRELDLVVSGGRRWQPPDIPGVAGFDQDGDRLRLLLEADDLVPRVLEHLAAQGAAVRSLEVRRCSLRDAFLRATGKALA